MIVFPPPTDGAIIQWPSWEHPAYDFACRTGEPIYAVHSGVLTYDYNSRMGNIAVVHASDGHRSTYSHMETVFPTGWYEKGDQIGTCGNTGSWSMGPHVHFESTYVYRF